MLAVLSLPVLAALSIAALARYARIRELPLYLTLPLVLSVLIPLSIVVLVPADLVNSDEALDSPSRLVMWRVIYWLSFALTWLVLPVLQRYVESGHFDAWLRLRDALQSTLRYQLILAAVGVAGLLYMGVSAGLSPQNLKALAVALSHSYALVITIWLLGHGLANVPRDVWNDQPAKRLKTLYQRAVPVSDACADAQSNYDDVVAKVLALQQVKTDRYAVWIDTLVEDIRSQDLPLSRTTAVRAQPRDLTEQNVASLSRRLLRDKTRALRSRAEWSKLVSDASFYEDIQQASQGTLEFRAVSGRHRLRGRPAFIWYVLVRPWAMRVLGVVYAMASVVIVWSELVSGTRLSLVDLAVKHSPGHLQLVLAATLLAYMCAATFSALAHLRIFNLYALVYRHSDPSSLVFYATYACRLAVPLSYNFLVLNSTQKTVFQEFLGKFINLTPLGHYFNELIPRLVIIPIAFTLFNFYEAIKDYLGFGIADFDDWDEGSPSENEGRELVRRALANGGASFTASYGIDIPPPAPAPQQPAPASILDRITGWFN